MNAIFRTALLCTLFGLSTAAFADDAKKSEKSDKAAKPVNKICPVEGGEVDPEVIVQHKGKTIGFCCAGCDEEFKKDPAKFMAKVDAELKNEGKAGKDKGEKHEGDKEAKHEGDAKAEGDAKEAQVNAKCPVSGDDADPAMTVDYKGRAVALCCEDCAKDFEKNPTKYLASLEAQDKAAAKGGDDHDHDGDGKADHDEKDHKDDHEHADDAKSEKPAK